MKSVIAAVIVLAALFFIVPIMTGGSINACQALEKHDVSATAAKVVGASNGPIYNTIISICQSATIGQIAGPAMSQTHPNPDKLHGLFLEIATIIRRPIVLNGKKTIR